MVDLCGSTCLYHLQSSWHCVLFESCRGLTWLEEHDGLEAGKLCGVDGKGLEAAEDLLQEAQVQAGVAGFALHAGAKVRQGEQRAAVQRQRPLDGTEKEELAPGLLQQDHLGGGQVQALVRGFIWTPTTAITITLYFIIEQ